MLEKEKERNLQEGMVLLQFSSWPFAVVFFLDVSIPSQFAGFHTHASGVLFKPVRPALEPTVSHKGSAMRDLVPLSLVLNCFVMGPAQENAFLTQNFLLQNIGKEN